MIDRAAYCFDYHGSLASLPSLVRLAGDLIAAGHPCYVVSAVGRDDPKVASYRDAIQAMPLAWSGVHILPFDGVPTPDIAYGVGMMKVGIMRLVRATLLFDDNPHIASAVRDAGLLCCHLHGREGA